MRYSIYVVAALGKAARTQEEFMELHTAVSDEIGRRAKHSNLEAGDAGTGFGCRDMEFETTDRDCAEGFVDSLGSELEVTISSGPKRVPIDAGITENDDIDVYSAPTDGAPGGSPDWVLLSESVYDEHFEMLGSAVLVKARASLPRDKLSRSLRALANRLDEDS